MGLLPLTMVLTALVGLGTSLVLALVQRPLVARLATLAPARRARWITALLATPLFVGLALVTIAIAPCATNSVLRGLDDCRPQLGLICRLCFAHPTHATLVAWALAAACAVPVVRSLARVTGSVRRTRRLARSLRAVAHRAGDGWIVPGAAAFVAGWPRGLVFLGEEVTTLGPAARAAIAAHEAAHLRRGDVHRRLLARMLAATHLPRPGRALIDALDLATEQACDAAAADAVDDPLLVAQTLIDVARLAPVVRDEARVAFTDAALAARVEALCAPRWHAGGVVRVLALGYAATFAASLVFAPRIHDAAEALVALLS